MDHFFGATFSENMLGVETRETEDEFIILCKLAGIKKEQITIESFENYLTITVDHEELVETTDEGATIIAKSYSANRASRNIPIPNYVEVLKLQASHRDGLLHIRIPKKNKRRIKIQD